MRKTHIIFLRRDIMSYKKMYYHLFNAITDAIEEFQTGDVLTARDLLIRAQQETEEMYLESRGKSE